MCIRVDLPEPEGPMTETNSPGLHVERDGAEGVDLVFTEGVDLGEVAD